MKKEKYCEHEYRQQFKYFSNGLAPDGYYCIKCLKRVWDKEYG